MKRFILLISLLAAACSPALIAQDAPPPPPEAGRELPPPGAFREKMRSELKHLGSILNLDDSQKKMVRQILQDRRDQMEGLDPEQRRGEAGQRIRADSMAKIRAILNADQQAKFDTWLAEMKAKGPGDRPAKRQRKGPQDGSQGPGPKAGNPA